MEQGNPTANLGLARGWARSMTIAKGCSAITNRGKAPSDMEQTGLGQAEVTLDQTCCSWHQGTSLRHRAALDLLQRPGEDVTPALEGTSSFLLSKGHAGCPCRPRCCLNERSKGSGLYERLTLLSKGTEYHRDYECRLSFKSGWTVS